MGMDPKHIEELAGMYSMRDKLAQQITDNLRDQKIEIIKQRLIVMGIDPEVIERQRRAENPLYHHPGIHLEKEGDETHCYYTESFESESLRVVTFVEKHEIDFESLTATHSFNYY
jgi:hypothetical protein